MSLQTASHELSELEASRAYQVGAYLTDLVPRLVGDDPTAGRIRRTLARPSILTITCLLTVSGSLFLGVAWTGHC